MMRLGLLARLMCLALFLLASHSAAAPGPPASRDAGRAAGQIVFPTSGSPEAQRIFLDGVRLLHNFEYEDAIETFRAAIKAQPDFAMGYWGLAMSYNHPLWNEQDLASAQRVLADLDKVPTSARSPREEGFVQAVKALYGNGDKVARDAAHAEAMRKLYEAFPGDDEVATFYALALLGTKGESQDFLVTVKASDVLEQVYSRNPRHPGVLHYLIHCYDDPRYASLGLRAADRYGTVALGSAHALHMPSHIYLDEGMWKSFVRVNEASWQASLDRLRRKKLGPGDYDIHGLHTLLWLEYGYLQLGQSGKARQTLDTMTKIHALNPTPMIKWYLAMMHAAYVVDASAPAMAREPSGAAGLELGSVELSARASYLYGTGLAAMRDRRPADARRAVGEIDAAVKGVQGAIKGDAGHHQHSFFTGTYEASIKPAQIMQAQLEALLALSGGKIEDAIALLQVAVADESRLPVGYGPPVPGKPSTELLGEVYLEAGRPQSAMRLFQLALLRYPKRAEALAGLHQAASLAGDREASGEAMAALKEFRTDSPGTVGPATRWPCDACTAVSGAGARRLAGAQGHYPGPAVSTP